MILAGRLNGHFFDDLLVDGGVDWDFLNNGFGDDKLWGSDGIGVGSKDSIATIKGVSSIRVS